MPVRLREIDRMITVNNRAIDQPILHLIMLQPKTDQSSKTQPRAYEKDNQYAKTEFSRRVWGGHGFVNS